MCQFIFGKLLWASLCFSAVFLVILVLYRVLKNILSAKQRYYLLILPLLLCLIPINLVLYFNEVQITEQVSMQGTAENSQVNEEQKQQLAQGKPNETTNGSKTINEARQPVITPGSELVSLNKYASVVKAALLCLWAIGSIVLAIYKGVYIVSLKKTLRRIAVNPREDMQKIFAGLNKNKRVELKCFDGISTPFITGIFKPTVFMPHIQMSEAEFSMALTHELVHIRRHDLIIKFLADFACVLHFFNPLVYVLKNRINTYCEISCDEAVVKNMDERQCRDYGTMLLSLMKRSSRETQAAICLSESEKNMKKRLEVIMKKSKVSKTSTTISIVLLCVLTAGSVAFAGTVEKLDTSKPPQTTYQSTKTYVSLYESNTRGKYYEAVITGGAVTFSNSMGRTTFEASYLGLPKELKEKADNLSIAGKENEARVILNNKGLYSESYKLKLSKEVRAYGDGYGMEGLFTLTKNNEVVFENKTGYLNSLPPCAVTWNSPDTTFDVEYEQDGKKFDLHISAKLDSRTLEQTKENEKAFAAMDKSKNTRKVILGEAVEIIYNGKKIDVAQVNDEYLKRMETQPGMNALGKIRYNADMQLAEVALPTGAKIEGSLAFLELWRGQKVVCDSDTIKGAFQLHASQYTDVVPMTISGLSNPVGGFVEAKTDDGKYYAKYTIVTEMKNPFTGNSTITTKGKDAIVPEEKVFKGTPREQDEFDKSEPNGLYKRIITNDEGGVVAIVPTENQISEKFSAKENVKRIYSISWEGLIGSAVLTTDADGTLVKQERELVLCDSVTRKVKVVIPIEYQF